jgi:hypothetical protein
MRKLAVVISLGLLPGCRALGDAFSPHPNVVVQVDGEQLTVGRFAELLVLGQPLPLRMDIADELARHWVNVTALARRAAAGDSLLDSATVLRSMWLERREALIDVFRDRLFADQESVTPATVDSAYRVGEMRLLAHVLRRVTPETTVEEKGRQLATALRLRDSLMGGMSWAEANQQSEDSTARANNGSLGIVKRGQTVPRFENAAFGLAPGELSQVTETQYGYHIIYRPRLAEVRAAFTTAVEQEIGAQLDSAYGEKLLADRAVEIRPTAAATIRELAQAPVRSLESTKVLATYDRGRLTAGQFARWLLYIPVDTYRQLLAAPDDQINHFTRQIVLQELLWQQVDSAGIQMSDSIYTMIKTRYRRVLESVYEVVRVWPDSLARLGATLPERQQIVRERVNRYFDAIAARQLPLRPIPPFLAEQLRQAVDWEILPAGMEAALRRAERLRAATEPATQPSPESNVP